MTARPHALALAAALVSLPVTSDAASLHDMRFEEVARGAELIVVGTVVDQRAFVTGKDINESRDDKSYRAPATRADVEHDDVKPEAVDKVEGGTMIFTEVTLKVEEDVAGGAPGTLTFVVAGGNDGVTRATVFGMPEFETGERYMLFMREGFRLAADPVMGVNKGLLWVSEDGRTLRNADGAVVSGVEKGELVLNRGDQDSRMRLAKAPVPLGKAEIRARTSPAVQAYWHREHPPADLDDFINDVLDLREGNR